VPVIAYASSAVPSTMDGGGVLVTDKDPVAVAGLIHEITTKPDLEDRILDSQDAALARLQARDFAGTLLKFVDQVQGMPHLPHPPTASDFWDQLKQAKTLADVRVYRPAAFQALPKPHEERDGNAKQRGHRGR
jgi:hypothetical protein